MGAVCKPEHVWQEVLTLAYPDFFSGLSSTAEFAYCFETLDDRSDVMRQSSADCVYCCFICTSATPHRLLMRTVVGLPCYLLRTVCVCAVR